MSEQLSSASASAPSSDPVDRTWHDDAPIRRLADSDVGREIQSFRDSIGQYYAGKDDDPRLDASRHILGKIDGVGQGVGGVGNDDNPYDNPNEAANNQFYPVFFVSDGVQEASVMQLDISGSVPYIANIVAHPNAPGAGAHLIAHALDQSKTGRVTLTALDATAKGKFEKKYGFVEDHPGASEFRMTLDATKKTVWKKINGKWKYSAHGHPQNCCVIM